MTDGHWDFYSTDGHWDFIVLMDIGLYSTDGHWTL